MVRPSKVEQVEEALRPRKMKASDWASPMLLICMLVLAALTALSADLAIRTIIAIVQPVNGARAGGATPSIPILLQGSVMTAVMAIAFGLMVWFSLRDRMEERFVPWDLIMDVTPADPRRITAQEAAALDRADSAGILHAMCLEIADRQKAQDSVKHSAARGRAVELLASAQQANTTVPEPVVHASVEELV